MKCSKEIVEVGDGSPYPELHFRRLTAERFSIRGAIAGTGLAAAAIIVGGEAGIVVAMSTGGEMSQLADIYQQYIPWVSLVSEATGFVVGGLIGRGCFNCR